MRSYAQALYPPGTLYALYEHASPRINATASALSRTRGRVAGFGALLGKNLAPKPAPDEMHDRRAERHIEHERLLIYAQNSPAFAL